ncbi:E3 ubiquitin-protein ligase ATL31-like isoform X1 [Arachis stenosperma]|uniref:E3 ubiquitin-protein ligase ATL31-like isoform X1 n=1 Tax=Arachis stenosperma TaxID=217475 RepID=UPI0025ACD07D|nr:E3 ubiquitin-protein ligase ATL31-like isoform X1 [Arachis stenosperma]
MTSLSKLFNRLCGRIIILLAYLLLQLIILIKKLESSFTGPIAKLQYLRFIEEKNPTIPYTNEMKPRHVQCTVCLSEFKEEEKVRSLKCQHVFHRDCLDTWLQEYRATCPLCRVKLLPDDVVSKRRVLRSQLGSDVNGDLWKDLEERYNHQKTVILPQARYEWTHLHLHDFKSINEYNSAMFRITSRLKLFGKKISDNDMLEKTFSTFHASNVRLQQQYREKGFKKYSELISCFLVAEPNNELLLRNHEACPAGVAPFSEANTANHYPRRGKW